ESPHTRTSRAANRRLRAAIGKISTTYSSVARLYSKVPSQNREEKQHILERRTPLSQGTEPRSGRESPHTRASHASMPRCRAAIGKRVTTYPGVARRSSKVPSRNREESHHIPGRCAPLLEGSVPDLGPIAPLLVRSASPSRRICRHT